MAIEFVNHNLLETSKSESNKQNWYVYMKKIWTCYRCNHVCAQRLDNTILCWGELEDGSSIIRDLPEENTQYSDICFDLE